MNNKKPNIEEITGKLQQEIMNAWSRVESQIFKVESQYKQNGSFDLSPLRDDMLKVYNVNSHEEIAGIYMIYLFNQGEEELFYVGESKSSIFRRLRRHFDKVEKQKNQSSPERYKPFAKLVAENTEVYIKILKFKDEDLKYRRIIEEILTLSEKPTYIDTLNENLVRRKDKNEL